MPSLNSSQFEFPDKNYFNRRRKESDDDDEVCPPHLMSPPSRDDDDDHSYDETSDLFFDDNNFFEEETQEIGDCPPVRVVSPPRQGRHIHRPSNLSLSSKSSSRIVYDKHGCDSASLDSSMSSVSSRDSSIGNVLPDLSRQNITPPTSDLADALEKPSLSFIGREKKSEAIAKNYRSKSVYERNDVSRFSTMSAPPLGMNSSIRGATYFNSSQRSLERPALYNPEGPKTSSASYPELADVSLSASASLSQSLPAPYTSGSLQPFDTNNATTPNRIHSAVSLNNRTSLSPRQSILTIEHVQKQHSEARPAGAVATIAAKPALILLLLYSIVSTGLWAYFLYRSLETPTKMEALTVPTYGKVDNSTCLTDCETAVAALENQIYRLGSEVTALHNQTYILQMSNVELAYQNEVFSNATATYKAENENLTTGLKFYYEQNSILNNSVIRAGGLNDQLNTTLMNLTLTLNKLERENDNLNASVIQIRKVNANLTQNVKVLVDTNSNLNSTIQDLSVQISNHVRANDDLKTHVGDLERILKFLNGTANGLNQTLTEISRSLAASIETNQVALLDTLQLSLEQSASNFECNFDARFAGSAWIADKGIPIGKTAYPKMIRYVNDTLSTSLCLNVTDFELLLVTDSNIAYSGSYPPPVDVTVNELVVGVDIYTTALLNYYFPDTGETDDRLTIDDWILSKFTCHGLPRTKRFIF